MYTYEKFIQISILKVKVVFSNLEPSQQSLCPSIMYILRTGLRIGSKKFQTGVAEQKNNELNLTIMTVYFRLYKTLKTSTRNA